MKESFNQSVARMLSDLPNTKTFLLTFRTYEISDKQLESQVLFQILVGEKKISSFIFWVVISWLLFTLKLIHDHAKWSIHELIHHVWLSITLNNLIARHKRNWTKNKGRIKHARVVLAVAMLLDLRNFTKCKNLFCIK